MMHRDDSVLKRIRIIEHKPLPSFGERLEAKAGAVIRHNRSDDREYSITWTLERELALTLSHINRARSLHQQLHRNLLRQECYIDTEIIQRQPRIPVYTDERLSERDRLRDRLRDIEKERRRLAVDYEAQLRSLHDRLLALLNRHTLLRI